MSRIEWIKAAAGRRPGHVEEFGQEDTVKKWVEAGLVRRVKAPVTPKEEPVKGPVSHKSMTRPPFDRAIRAPVTKKKKAKAKAKTRRRW